MLFTESEAAEQLRIPAQRLAKLARAKEITCVMVTPTVRCYRQSDLDEYISAREVPCKTRNSASVDSGSTDEETAHSGTSTGPSPDETDDIRSTVAQLAQQTFRRRSSS